MENILWHLPGLYMNIDLYKRLIPIINDNKHVLKDGNKFHTVYGLFPNAIWNGGRLFVGNNFCTKDNIEYIAKFYKEQGIHVALTCTNSLLKEMHLHDTYCNLILDIFHEEGNYVIVTSDLLREYIQTYYPKYCLIASVARNSEVDKKGDISYNIERYWDNYDLIVLDHEYNGFIVKDGYLSQYCSKKLEVMVNQKCISYCEYEKDHYKNISEQQLSFSQSRYFKCPHKRKELSEGGVVSGCYYNEDTFISSEKVNELHELGINHFKIVGRTEDNESILKWFIYYLIKDEYKDFIIDKVLKGD